MVTIILVCLLAAVLSGGSGYYISFKFNRSNYAATDTSGDFGAPRGGFFALLGGSLIGLWFFALLGKYLFPAETIGPAIIVSLIVGAVAGVVGMFQGIKSRNRNKPADSEKKPEEQTPKDEEKK